MLGGVTRLDAPGNTDQPVPRRQGSESLFARLLALAPNHPSSLHFGRSEQRRVREATAAETVTAEAGAASPAPSEGQAQQCDGAGWAEMKASADAKAAVMAQSAEADVIRPGEQAASGDRRPLVDSEFAEHIEMMNTRLADAKDRGLDTDRLYTVPPDHKSWTPDRLVAQMGIIDDLYGDSGDAPCEGQAVIAGGLGARERAPSWVCMSASTRRDTW
jgi:hypothetical protein